jgi:hypothetical protein
MPKLHYSRATTGEKVAECLLDPADAGWELILPG